MSRHEAVPASPGRFLGKLGLVAAVAAVFGGVAALTTCATPPASPPHEDRGAADGAHSLAPETPSDRVDWRVDPASPMARSPFTITYEVRDLAGKTVRDFDVVHEKLTHLIVVSSDLVYFDHIHPEWRGDHFEVKTTVPHAGSYKLFADLTPSEGKQLISPYTLSVGGANPPAAVPLAIDSNLTKDFGGLRVTLVPDMSPLRAGKATMMTFRLADAESGRPVRDLGRYLGAFGHCVIISEDTETFLHTHPMDERKDDARGGPDVAFHSTFPSAGPWKIWAQFNRHGKIVTAEFVVSVVD